MSSSHRAPRGTAAVAALAAAVLLGVPAPAAGVPDDGSRLRQASADAATAALPVAGPVDVVTVRLDRRGRPDVTAVRAADPRAAAWVIRSRRADATVTSVEIGGRVRAFDHPHSDDPRRLDQWALTRLAAEHLWDGSDGTGVTVAVIDSGADGGHPDLQGVLVPGVDYVAGSGTGTVDPNGHGTHVAGTVAAVAGNAVGVAGLAPGARVMPLRVLDATGWGEHVHVAQAIVAAVDRGADVINLSLGGDRSSSVESAVRYAIDSGVPVVAAMGNARLDGDPVRYPAALDGVIAVAASTRADVSARFSSTGPHVAVTAPGTAIVSTYPGGYGYSDGTSMAAPHVAATVATLLSRRPDLSPAQVRSVLTSTADDLETPGFDSATGAGLVDPAAALAAVGVLPAPKPPAPAPPTTLAGLPRDWQRDGAGDVLAKDGVGRLFLYRGSGKGGFLPGRTQIGHGWNGRDLMTLTGDWDGDGSADLVARDPADGVLWLYPGTGTGTFKAARRIGVGWNGIDVLLSPSDWSGDGAVDLLARRRSDGGLVLYPGNGRGGFLPARQVGWGWGDMSLVSVAGDWDTDGRPDLVARDAGGRLLLYRGNGRGGFLGSRQIGVGWQTVSTLAGPGDWTGDRRPDLLAVMTDGTMRVYPSSGTGGFSASSRIGVGWSGLTRAV